MKTHVFLMAVGLLAAAPLSVHARVERIVEKNFSVHPGGTLTVETQGGEIRVQPSSDNAVHVVAKERFRTDSDTEADDILKNLSLTIEQSGDSVKAVSKYEKDIAGFHWGSWPPVQVSFVVTVPTSYNVDLKTSGGDIKIGDLNGKARLHTSGGDLVLGKISGDIEGGTSGGDVRLAEGAGTVRLNTSGGDIHVDRAIGRTNLDTSGGTIRIEAVENTLHATTSGGDVSARIIGALKGDCSLGTSGGRVRLTVDKGAAFDLDASTSGGDVEAEGLTITIERGGVGKSRLAGKVNGGGPQVHLRSSGGDITVMSR